MRYIVFGVISIGIFLWAYAVGLTLDSNPRVKEWLNSAQVIYKLTGDRYEQITSFDQIKDGIYIIIR